MHFRAKIILGILTLASGFDLYASANGEAGIQIKARSGGVPLPAAYVALVPDDQPWSQPLRETIAGDSGEVEWQVPPGKYRLVVGAPDYWWEKSPAFELEAGATPRRETIELRRLGRARGRLAGLDGRPIAGARVGDLYAFLAAPSNQLSPLGEKHLAGNWEVRSQNDGSFALPALEGHRFSALIEAAGYEPGLIDNHLLRAEEPEILELKLAPGASLTVTWTEKDDLAPGLLQLKPRDRGFLSKVPMVVPEWIWERPALGGKAEWVALPAGDYELYWIGSEPVQKPATRLAHLKLQAGRREERAVELPVAAAAAPAPATEPGLPLRLKLEGDLPPRFENLEATTLTDAGWRVLPAKLERSAGGPRLDLESGRRPGSRVVVAAKGLFGATAELERDGKLRELALPLLPRADVKGLLHSPPGEKMPTRGLLRAMSCPPAGEVHRERVAVPVEIEPSGAWRAPIPAGCTCLVLEAGAFAALSWHKVETRAGESADAGKRQLVHGAHLLVRLANTLGEPIAGAQVDVLFPEEAESVARSGAGRLDHLATLQRARSAADGWAELRGLPAGRYFLRAVLPGSSLSVFSEPVVLAADQQEVIDPWTFPASGSLDLRLKAKKAVWADYQVFLESKEAEPRLRLDRKPDNQGRARFPEVPPGPWTLRVFYRPDGGRSEVAVRSLEIGPSEELRQEISVEAQSYRAQLALATGPLLQPGRVELFAREGASAPISAKIDEEGKFEIRLPGPGKYSGRFFLPELKRRISVPVIHFEDPDRVTEIPLPAGKIEGVVVTEEGEPAERVSVLAEKFEETPGSRPVMLSQIAPSDELGRFAFDFLQEGSWTLSAQSPEGKSEKLEIGLAGSEQKTGIVLRLDPSKQIRGRVLAATGQPVAGARVTRIALAGELGEQSVAITAFDGTFSFRKAASETAGGAFWIQFPGGLVAYQKAAGDEVILTAPAEPGELRLPPGEAPERWELQSEDGSAMNWDWLAAESGDRHALRLAPGIWRLRRQDESIGQTYEVEPGESLIVDPRS